MVLGRKTYEGLAGYWPSQSGKWADMVNPMPKYVGSNTLSGDLDWNATLLEGDLEDSIPRLKDEVDGDLFMHGSGAFGSTPGWSSSPTSRRLDRAGSRSAAPPCRS